MPRPKLALLFFPLLLLLLLLATTSHAHNITRILAKDPEFSTFNQYLTRTHLAADINRRLTITVLAVDNAGMSSLLSKGFPLYTIRNVLSLHILVDYFGAKKLHQISKGSTLTSSVFQASGAAPGTSGFVNITNLKGGKVGFGVEDNDGHLNSRFVKSIKEIPYNISVIQISQVLTSAEAEAPTSGPSELNVTSILSKQGCKSFADLLIATGADTTYQSNTESGLTIFCPTDGVIKGFMPKYKNLTAPKKLSLLLYHGIPVYQSLQMLKQNNGVVNTLATDRANKYDFTVQTDGEYLTLETTVVTSKVTGTLIDKEPLAVYKLNKVLMPKELYKSTEAASPKSSSDDSDKDADAPESDSDDQTADDNGAVGINGGTMAVVFLSLCVGYLLV
ncbi:fasciclin-like arabinogalactan protein 2 [Humulus lupulus]|uniref:fasciclin-like arabinogalactan protein 2 n=1 Tax=Humulus lupulus TaxID=3486 RepID=UPI002B40E91C|nr:fasciclin-like arabinogalactan protein 2 [Humulus lupulus]